jgi:FtsZ-interacting cell division protein ZipA
MEQKNNTTLIIIIVSIIIVVGMILGLIFWMMSRQFELNEKLLDVRLAESKKTQEESVVVPMPTHSAPVTQVITHPSSSDIPNQVTSPKQTLQAPEKKPVKKTATTKSIVNPKNTPVAQPSKKITPKQSQPKKATVTTVKSTQETQPVAPAVSPTAPTKNTQSTASTSIKTTSKNNQPKTPKRIAPVEKEGAPEGIDGLPKDRINLEIGNDSLEWQL